MSAPIRESIPVYTASEKEKPDNLKDQLGELKDDMPKTLSLKEKQEMQKISHSDFLKYSDMDRLRLITEPSILVVNSWDRVTFNFNFTGKWDNEGLYMSTTAGQVLPDSVGSVKIWDTEYSRSSLDGEFFDVNNNRLVIKTGTQIDIHTIRTRSQMVTMMEEADQKLWNYEGTKQEEIAREALHRWFDPGFVISLFASFNISDIALEELFTEMDRQRGFMQLSSWDDRLKRLLIARFFNKSQLIETEKTVEWYKNAAQQIARWKWIPEDIYVNLVNKENRRWNPTIKNPKSTAYGLTQIIDGTWNRPSVWKWLDRYDPIDQLIAWANYLSYIKNYKNCSWEEATAFYNTWEWFDKDSLDPISDTVLSWNLESIVWQIPWMYGKSALELSGQVTKQQYFKAASAYYSWIDYRNIA